MIMSSSNRTSSLVPHRQPGPVRTGDPRPGRRSSPERIVEALDDGRHPAGAGGVEAGAHRLRRDPTDHRGGERRPGLHRSDRLDAHVLAGEDVDRRARRAARRRSCTCTPRRTCQLPWAEIDMDFMNLNQAAHGDREFGYIQTRLGVPRKTVAGHVVRPDDARPRIAGWARAARGVARDPLAAAGPVRRQHARRRGHRGRQGRGRAAVRRLGQHLRRQRPGRAGRRRHRRRGRRPGRSSTTTRTTIAPELRAGGDRHESLRYGAQIEGGLRSFLTEGGFGAFTTNFEDLGGLRQLPGLAVQRLMADGLRVRRRGRLEDLGHAARDQGDGRRPARRYVVHGGLHLRPRPGHAKILGAHMLEVCPSIAVAKPRVEIHPLGIGGREDPVRLVFDAAPGPGHRARHLRPRRPVPARAQRGRGRAVGRAAAQAAGRPRGLGAEAEPGYLGGGLAHRRRAAPHGAVDRGRHRSAGRTSPICSGSSC